MRKKNKHKIFADVFNLLIFNLLIKIVRETLIFILRLALFIGCLFLIAGLINLLQSTFGWLLDWAIYVFTWAIWIALWVEIGVVSLGMVLFMIVLILERLKLLSLSETTSKQAFKTSSNNAKSSELLSSSEERSPGITNWTCANVYPIRSLFLSCTIHPGAKTCEGCHDYRSSEIPEPSYELNDGTGITNWACTNVYPIRSLSFSCTIHPGAENCEGCRDYRSSEILESNRASNNRTNESSFNHDISSGLGHYYRSLECGGDDIESDSYDNPNSIGIDLSGDLSGHLESDNYDNPNSIGIGDLTCEYNAHSAFLRCAVHPGAENCEGCRDYRSTNSVEPNQLGFRW